MLRHSVTCPTLVATADYSESFADDNHIRVAGGYSRGRHDFLTGTGRMVMWESVTNTVAVLNEFLR